MQITKNSIETAAGPREWFTGMVYIDTVATPSAASRLQASSVHFTPGARTAWHTHPNGQTIYLTLRRGYSPTDSRFIPAGIPAGIPASPRRACPAH